MCWIEALLFKKCIKAVFYWFYPVCKGPSQILPFPLLHHYSHTLILESTHSKSVRKRKRGKSLNTNLKARLWLRSQLNSAIQTCKTNTGKISERIYIQMESNKNFYYIKTLTFYYIYFCLNFSPWVNVNFIMLNW
jgi:hypothetical protein